MLTRNLSLHCYTVAGPYVHADYGPYVEEFTFTTVEPGGYGELTAHIKLADVRQPRPELAMLNARVALMAGSSCIWLGEITEPAQVVDDQSERFQLRALGIGNWLRDDPETSSYTNKTVMQVMSDQYSQRSAFTPLSSDQSQIFPDQPGATFSPAYVQRNMEEVIGDLVQLSGDYVWGVWAQPGLFGNTQYTDAGSFPLGRLEVQLRNTTTTTYIASYAQQEIMRHTVTPSAERAYNDIVITYYDPASGTGTKTAKDSRLNANNTQGTAPFRYRRYSRDLSGISTVNATQAQNIANSLLTLYQNPTNTIAVKLKAVRDAAGNDLDLFRVQAHNANILLTDLASRGTPLPTSPVATTNQFHIVKTTYHEISSGDVELDIECDNFFPAPEVQIARLQLEADYRTRVRTTTGVVQAAGAPLHGQCGAQLSNVTNGVVVFVFVPFPTIMANVPSSITLSNVVTTNAGSVTATAISIYGFALQWTPSGTPTKVTADYQTVGNCFTAVDPVAMTFDRHCDTCGNDFTGLPLSSLAQLTSAFDGSQSLVCTCACGAIESFYPHFTPTQADAATWQGDQADLIRTAMQALGMTIAQHPQGG